MVHARFFGTGYLLAGLMILGSSAANAGGLSFVEAQQSFFFVSDPLRSANAVAVSYDGTAVIVAADASGGSVSFWGRNPSTCGLTFQGSIEDGEFGVDNMRKPTAVAESPDGECLYLTSALDDSIVVFCTSGFSFKKDGVDGVDGLNGASGVVVSPDSACVYVSGRSDTAVAVFSQSGGTLTFVEAERPVSAPEALAISPDGAHLYVAGGDPAQVAVFSRDAGTCELTPVEVDPIERLAAPVSAVAVSPDGANVYVAIAGANAVVVFTRDAITGALTFLETQHGGLVKGIGGASGLAVSPLLPDGGKYVYVSGAADAALAVFARDATQGGRLRFLEVDDASVLGTDDFFSDNPLGQVTDVAVSPDGHCVYAVGHGSIAVFAVDSCGNGVTGVDEQCDDGNAVSGDGCSDTCRLELCGGTPIAGCRTTIRPGGASLRIKNHDDDTRDQLSWKWRGQATTLADFGDPTATASYVACVYDGSAQPQPLLSRAAPADGNCGGKPCWTAAARSYRYKDLLLTPDGLKQVRLKEGLVDGKATLRFEGLGNFLSPPSPLTLPVTVQVTNTQTNVCWEAVYSTADTNDAAHFKAKSD